MKILIANIENSFGIKIDKIYEMKPEDVLKSRIILSGTLIVLAVLNLYLVPHQEKSRYPEGIMKFGYGKELPLMEKFNDIVLLLKRCLSLAENT